VQCKEPGKLSRVGYTTGGTTEKLQFDSRQVQDTFDFFEYVDCLADLWIKIMYRRLAYI
jgi:hypothetical protein